MRTIVLPPRLTSDQMTRLAAAADAVATDAKAERLDARAVRKWGPLSMVELGLAIAQRRRLGHPTLTFLPPTDEVAAHFSDEAGLARLLAGEESTRRAADTLELRQMTTHDRLYTERIADVLVERVEGYDEDASHLVHLCLNELLQNVFEWAASPEGAFVHARRYRKDGNVRIAVADAGMGIPGALREKLQRESDLEIVEAAVTRAGLTSSPRASRGLGLKLIRDIVTSRQGRLTVASHTALVSFGPGDLVRPRRCGFVRGTAVEIDFRPHLPARPQEAIL